MLRRKSQCNRLHFFFFFSRSHSCWRSICVEQWSYNTSKLYTSRQTIHTSHNHDSVHFASFNLLPFVYCRCSFFCIPVVFMCVCVCVWGWGKVIIRRCNNENVMVIMFFHLAYLYSYISHRIDFKRKKKSERETNEIHVNLLLLFFWFSPFVQLIEIRVHEKDKW